LTLSGGGAPPRSARARPITVSTAAAYPREEREGRSEESMTCTPAPGARTSVRRARPTHRSTAPTTAPRAATGPLGVHTCTPGPSEGPTATVTPHGRAT